MSVVRASLAVPVALFCLSGCGSTPDGYVYPPDTTLPNVLTMHVDTDATLASDPEKTPVVMVEYRTGGAWHVSTSCDTKASKYTCDWDLVVSLPEGDALSVEDKSTELERDDQVLTIDRRAVRLIFQTDVDTDGVVLDGPAGSTLRVDAVLDGSLDNATISWVSGGEITIAGSNPVDLIGTVP